MVSTGKALAVAIDQRSVDTASPLPYLMARFLAAQDVRPSSKATYARSLKVFCRWLEATGRDHRGYTLTRDHLLEFKTSLARLSPHTRNNVLSALRKFFTWLEDEGIAPNLAKRLRNARAPKPGSTRDILSNQQMTALFHSFDIDSPTGLRNLAIATTAAYTGVRCIELSRARVGDLRPDPLCEPGEAVLMVQGKGHDAADEPVLLKPEVYRVVRLYLDSRAPAPDEAPLFANQSDRYRGKHITPRSVSGILKGAFRRAGIDSPRITAHSLRHGAVTRAILAGGDVLAVQSMARHANVNTTIGYLHRTDRLQSAAERLVSFE